MTANRPNPMPDTSTRPDPFAPFLLTRPQVECLFDLLVLATTYCKREIANDSPRLTPFDDYERHSHNATTLLKALAGYDTTLDQSAQPSTILYP